MTFKTFSINVCLALSFTFLPVGAREIEIRVPNGDNFVVDLNSEDTILNFLGQIEELLEPESASANVIVEGGLISLDQEWVAIDDNQKFVLEFTLADNTHNFAGFKKAKSNERDYNAPITKDEKKNISYIVTTLANKSLVKLLSLKSSLEKVGDKVNHVHPFRFLQCIYTDEELKVCIHNIMGRGWVWKDFMKGLSESLNEEAQRNNLRQECINDFAKIVGIDPGLINTPIQEHRWEDFVKLLSVYIPRQGNPDRYDM